jgi:hypothetical protein
MLLPRVALTHVSTTYLSDIDPRSLVASYEHEARKKVLSTFYIAHPSPFLAQRLAQRDLFR